MKRKLYGNHITACCSLCEHGRLAADGNTVLCPHKGVVPLFHHCRKFVYDPLRRVPERPEPITPHRPEEFEL